MAFTSTFNMVNGVAQITLRASWMLVGARL